MSGMAKTAAELKHHGDRAAYKAARRREADLLLEMHDKGYRGRKMLDSAITACGFVTRALRSSMLDLPEPVSSEVEMIAAEMEGLRTRLMRIDHERKEGA